jgi:hypothetical protein
MVQHVAEFRRSTSRTEKEAHVKKTVGLAVMLLLVLSHLAAADPVIKPGIDVFRTLGKGKTYYDFGKKPIPAGFFCDSSPAFTSRVALKGLPVTTKIPGQLAEMDTIIERLDPAVFNEQGVAETRVRFRAVSMVSVAPIKTSCGAYHVYVTLAGKQPITKMRIHRTQEGGGTFRAPLAAKVSLTFVPVEERNARHLKLKGSVSFPAQDISWSFSEGTGMKQFASAVVDTDGDLIPDTRLPGTSNFAASYPPEGIRSIFDEAGCSCCTCHAADGEMHCTNTYPCQSCC